MEIPEELRKAYTLARGEADVDPRVWELLARLFGDRNAALLAGRHRNVVGRLHESHEGIIRAVESWDGSLEAASRLAYLTQTYQEQMAILLAVCRRRRAGRVKSISERREERAAYHRGQDEEL